ncbi:MAG: tetraacyldisaccharide 4'-kinase [Desulfobulbaceae bacterium]|nr:tetraacyldisaccharide 4'-kinase [Desulfobulbaceae bacterium]HIJ79091.1 tetraacyldisaccharide 4'-kinase [Deltaproteobacteria bacterium]
MSRFYQLLFVVGRLFTPLYSAGMMLRAFLYKKNIFLKSQSLPVPVISIGNLTMGGTGKTPLVLYVSRYLLGLGRKPAIVSRGYGAKIRGPVTVVSDGQKIITPPQFAGDEPSMMAESLAGVPVLIGPKRPLVCRRALEQFKVNAIVLDDGFQHLALARDVDLVLFSARTFLGSGWVFPGGELREPFSALKRAHSFVVTGVDNSNRNNVESFQRLLKGVFPEKPVFLGEYLPVSLLSSKHAKTYPIDKGKRLPVFGFAGIANPEAFRHTLKKEKFLLTGFRSFNDHHQYTASDVNALVDSALARKARALITTEKDFVKLKPFFGDFPILALKIELLMGEDFDLFISDRLSQYVLKK